MERFKEIMNKGGWTILIMFIALGIYVIGVDYASSCANEVNAPVTIEISEDGQLYVKYIYEDYKNLHVLWETDGGNIKPVNENDKFKEQYTDENKGYFCYTNVAEKVQWNPSDADGNNYTTANVRALLYQEMESQSVYNMQDYIIELYLTVTLDENGKAIEAKERYFSSPIREDGATDWNQIYPIFEGEDGNVTYRYRTGTFVDGTKEIYLRWSCSEPVLSETDILSGYVPSFKISTTVKNLNNLTQINTVTVDTSALESGKDYNLEAYLVESEYFDDENISEENKMHKATMKIGG